MDLLVKALVEQLEVNMQLKKEMTELKEEFALFRKENREMFIEVLNKLKKYEPEEAEKIERHLKLVKNDEG